MDRTSLPQTQSHGKEGTTGRRSADPTALELLNKLAAPLEILGNLIYLTEHDAEYSEKTRHFMKLAEEQMTLVRSVARETFGISDSVSIHPDV